MEDEVKYIAMTDEYAAQYWHQQGWLACRLAFLFHRQAEEDGL
jgi:hypothetical protein